MGRRKLLTDEQKLDSYLDEYFLMMQAPEPFADQQVTSVGNNIKALWKKLGIEPFELPVFGAVSLVFDDSEIKLEKKKYLDQKIAEAAARTQEAKIAFEKRRQQEKLAHEQAVLKAKEAVRRRQEEVRAKEQKNREQQERWQEERYLRTQERLQRQEQELLITKAKIEKWKADRQVDRERNKKACLEAHLAKIAKEKAIKREEQRKKYEQTLVEWYLSQHRIRGENKQKIEVMLERSRTWRPTQVYLAAMKKVETAIAIMKEIDDAYFADIERVPEEQWATGEKSLPPAISVGNGSYFVNFDAYQERTGLVADLDVMVEKDQYEIEPHYSFWEKLWTI